MIDDPYKTALLIARLKEHLPIAAAVPKGLQRSLAAKSPEMTIPARCKVVDVLNLGDEGGVACCLDIGGPDTKHVHIVSITHILFDRHSLLSRKSAPTSVDGPKNSSGSTVAASDPMRGRIPSPGPDERRKLGALIPRQILSERDCEFQRRQLGLIEGQVDDLLSLVGDPSYQRLRATAFLICVRIAAWLYPLRERIQQYSIMVRP